MDHSRECPTITFLLLVYVANTILMYISLKGDSWLTYTGGHSGLWNHCNNTGTGDNDTTYNNTDEENCDYINITEASVSLHHVRAFFIIGFICWCLGMIQRYLTWQHRGTKVDKHVILLALLCSLSVFLAAFLFTAFVQKEYLKDGTKYANVHFGVDHTLAFVGASLTTLLVFVSIRHHNMLNSSTSLSSWAKHFPCFHPGSRLIACCGKRDTRAHATSQASRTPSRPRANSQPSTSTSVDISVNATDNSDNYSSARSDQRHSSLQDGLVLLAATLSVRRNVAGSEQPGRDRPRSVDYPGMTDNDGDISVVPTSGISEWSSRRAGEEGDRRGRHIPLVDVMALPPAYDDVIGVGSRQENGANPPPSYDEVICNRELVLSPPPAYEESNG